MNAPRIGSMFSGAGGLDMAVQQVTGGETVWVADVCGEPDPKKRTLANWPHRKVCKAPCTILAHRFPGIPNLGDVATIDFTHVEPIDILTGGFPCQDLSHAGKRAGLKEGTRSGLWSHMARAIDNLRPRLVVAENVRGLLSADAPGDVEPCPWCVGEAPTVNLRALGVVLADLAELGYDAQWCGLRAADVGACHGRFRVFLIAYPTGNPWRFGHGDSGDAAEFRGADVALLPTPAVNDMGAGKTVEDWDTWTDAMKAKHGNGNGHGASLAIEAQRLLPTPMADDARRDPAAVSAAARKAQGHQPSLGGVLNDLLPTPTARDWKNAGDPQRTEARMADRGQPLTEVTVNLLPTPTSTDHKASGASYPSTDTHQQGTTLTDATVRQPERFGDYAPAIARWEQALYAHDRIAEQLLIPEYRHVGRPAPDPTEPTGKGGANRLSPAFVEWMMGWPAGWVTDVPGITRNEALKACGNGVVPQQAIAALRHLLAREQVAA